MRTKALAPAAAKTLEPMTIGGITDFANCLEMTDEGNRHIDVFIAHPGVKGTKMAAFQYEKGPGH